MILGIDPGSRLTGYAVLYQAGTRVEVVDSGVIKLGAASLSARLALLHRKLDELLCRAGPTEAAVEGVFSARNARSALLLGHARGVALAAIGCRGVMVSEYSPGVVKRAVVGHGRAGKEQIQRMVQMRLSLRRLPQEDEADAMAIAICHGMHRGRVAQPVSGKHAVAGLR